MLFYIYYINLVVVFSFFMERQLYLNYQTYQPEIIIDSKESQSHSNSLLTANR